MRLRTQFALYATGGGMSFAIDLILLAFFVEILHWNYIVGTVAGFLLSTLVHYLFLRKTAFRSSRRSHTKAYGVFAAIMSISLAMVTGLMYLAVTILSYNYLISRIAIAGLVGIVNFFLHRKITFGK